MLHSALPAFPILHTERLTLRELSPNDADEIFSLRSDESINKYLGRKPCATKEDALKFINSIRENEALYWAIAQSSDDKLIGTICLFDFSADNSQCEIGYELMTAFQGKGMMMEAAKAIIDFAENKLAVKTIVASTHKKNESSSALLRKLGFEQTDLKDEEVPELIIFKRTT